MQIHKCDVRHEIVKEELHWQEYCMLHFTGKISCKVYPLFILNNDDKYGSQNETAHKDTLANQQLPLFLVKIVTKILTDQYE